MLFRQRSNKSERNWQDKEESSEEAKLIVEELEVKRPKWFKEREKETKNSKSPRREVRWRWTTGNRGEDHRGEQVNLSIWCCWCLGGGLGGWQRMCAKWQGPYVFKSWTPSWVIGNHRKTFHTGTMRSRFWVLLIFCFNFRKFWFSFISFSLSLSLCLSTYSIRKRGDDK